MAKGYWIAQLDVLDADGIKAYMEVAPGIVAKFGGRFLSRAGRYIAVEGSAPQRNNIIEFPSFQAALDCWNSPEYTHAIALRQGVAKMSVVVVEGYDGPQPVAT